MFAAGGGGSERAACGGQSRKQKTRSRNEEEGTKARGHEGRKSMTPAVAGDECLRRGREGGEGVGERGCVESGCAAKRQAWECGSWGRGDGRDGPAAAGRETARSGAGIARPSPVGVPARRGSQRREPLETCAPHDMGPIGAPQRGTRGLERPRYCFGPEGRDESPVLRSGPFTGLPRCGGLVGWPFEDRLR